MPKEREANAIGACVQIVIATAEGMRPAIEERSIIDVAVPGRTDGEFQ
jgi:hypothetical protein